MINIKILWANKATLVSALLFAVSVLLSVAEMTFWSTIDPDMWEVEKIYFSTIGITAALSLAICTYVSTARAYKKALEQQIKNTEEFPYCYRVGFRLAAKRRERKRRKHKHT